MATKEGVLLTSAARTTEQTTPWQSNPGCKYLVLSLNITADPVSADLTPRLEGRDPASGTAYTVWTAAAAASATGIFNYALGPGLLAATPGGHTDTENVVVPPTWRVVVAVGDTDSCTYSLGYALTG